jgi:hypothetical protein
MLPAVFSRSSLAVHGCLLGDVPGAAVQARSAGRAGVSGIRGLVQLVPAASQLQRGHRESAARRLPAEPGQTAAGELSNRVSFCPDDGCAGSVEAAGAAAVLTAYYARPGRRVIVITDLADLSRPVDGTVTLPLWLYWSGPSPAFDLGVPSMRRWLYEIVLREAAGTDDLTRFLDREMLIALWPELYLPKGVRQAWEEHHPVLRAAAAA